MSLITLTPDVVHEQVAAGRARLIDVREPHEFEDVRIEGALNLPLSSFDPAALPQSSDGETLIIMCAGGVRSAQAVAICQAAGLEINTHLGGGIRAWAMAGLPITR